MKWIIFLRFLFYDRQEKFRIEVRCVPQDRSHRQPPERFVQAFRSNADTLAPGRVGEDASSVQRELSKRLGSHSM
jgi:hypothetical protein